MAVQRRNTGRSGFTRASALLQAHIREASSARGFGETRILTHWREVVGASYADVCLPVKVSYKRSGIGATLTILTTGAQAPMLEMQKQHILDKVNACYGYRAIHEIRITQTAPTGFAEGQASFRGPKAVKLNSAETKRVGEAAMQLATDIQDERLKVALAKLGGAVLTRYGKNENQE
jgi:hypothetical protein